MEAALNNARKVSAILWSILVPSAVAFAIFALGLFWFGETSPGAIAVDDRYDVLKDVLTITLSVAAVVIAALGIGAFALLRVLLYREVVEQVGEKFLRAMSWNLVNHAYALWDHHRETNESFLLRQAIEFTADAHLQARELDESRRLNREIRNVVRNNWGYYLAEKAMYTAETGDDANRITEEERAFALSLARRLEDEMAVFPEHAQSFADTIQHIRTYCE